MARLVTRFGLLLAFATLIATSALADSYVFGGATSTPFATLTVTTSTGTTVLTATNQGWVDSSDNIYVEAPGNYNYVVGSPIDGSTFTDFFTFNVSNLTGTVTGASLNLNSGDVSIDASCFLTCAPSLNFGTTLNASAYGIFGVPPSSDAPTSFGLTGSTVGDISQDVASGIFTIDGSLLFTALPPPACEFSTPRCVIVHQGGGNGSVPMAEDELGPTVQTPEPNTVLFLLFGALLVAVVWRKARSSGWSQLPA